MNGRQFAELVLRATQAGNIKSGPILHNGELVPLETLARQAMNEEPVAHVTGYFAGRCVVHTQVVLPEGAGLYL